MIFLVIMHNQDILHYRYCLHYFHQYSLDMYKFVQVIFFTVCQTCTNMSICVNFASGALVYTVIIELTFEYFFTVFMD